MYAFITPQVTFLLVVLFLKQKQINIPLSSSSASQKKHTYISSTLFLFFKNGTFSFYVSHSFSKYKVVQQSTHKKTMTLLCTLMKEQVKKSSRTFLFTNLGRIKLFVLLFGFLKVARLQRIQKSKSI